MRTTATITAMLLLLLISSAGAQEVYRQAMDPDNPETATAATANGAIVADDIPASLIGTTLTQVFFTVGEENIWTPDYWVTPSSVTVYFFDTQCQPSGSPTHTFEIAWDDMNATLVPSPIFTQAYEVVLDLPEAILVTAGMSIGFSVATDNNSGGAMTSDVVYGSCIASLYFAAYDIWVDLDGAVSRTAAFAWGVTSNVVATEETTWGSLKANYR